uniref:Anoctamin n=1 Tax=Heterorhabditis bacteriophora TaxID=37862 RepID=A0A1I7WHK8_HETBA
MAIAVTIEVLTKSVDEWNTAVAHASQTMVPIMYYVDAKIIALFAISNFGAYYGLNFYLTIIFCNRDKSLEDEDASGRPLTIDDNQLRTIFEADPCKTT